MLLLIALLLLFMIPIALLALENTKLRAGYLWFLALGSALAVWVLVIFSRVQLPIQIVLMRWQPDSLFMFTPTLLLDEISWTYAAVLAVYPLVILLTDIIQVENIDSQAWAATLGIAGLSLLAVLAENPLTLMLAWTMMDLAEMVMLLQRVSHSQQRERVIITFSVRQMGVFFLLTAAMVAQVRGEYLTFKNIPADISGILLLAVGLRLGVLPPHQPFFQEPPLRRGLGTMVRLASVASSLTLLARLAVVGVPLTWQPYLLVVAVLAALYSSFAWIQAKDELDGRPFWILGMATFSLIAAVRNMPAASIAWGIALLSVGGVLFLASYRSRFISMIAIFGLLGISALPYTPLWPGGSLYGQLNVGFLAAFVVSHALMLVGYLQHSRRRNPENENIEPWMKILYPLGLILLILNHWGISWMSVALLPDALLRSNLWWIGFVVVGIVGLIALLASRGISLQQPIFSTFRSVLSLEWMYRFFWWLYRTLARGFGIISQIFEGEGGILWAILILILLVSIMQQSGGAS